MPLSSTGDEASWSNELRVFKFTMLNGAVPVVVVVTPLAIDACVKNDLIDVYQRAKELAAPGCRATIEAIASAKFDAGKIENDGSVRVGQSDAQI